MANISINPNGKVAFVSGANRGIGKEIVKELIEKGIAKIYAGVRNTASLDHLVAEHGSKVEAVQLDLTDQASIAQAAKSVGKVDILINNAGVLIGGQLLAENAIDTLNENFGVNVFGLVTLTNSLFDLSDTTTQRAVVSVSSLAGIGNMPVIGTYSVSKAAVHSIIQGLRAELSEHNTLVMGVYPGPIETDMTKGFEMDMDSPQNVAKNVVQGLIDGTENVYPDQMSQIYGEKYAKDPVGVAAEFGQWK